MITSKPDLYLAFHREYEFQRGCFYTGFIDKDDGIFAWNDRLPFTPWWNHAAKLFDQSTGVTSFVEEAIQFFREKQRYPAINITSFSKPNTLSASIIRRGFKVENTDAWMFYEQDPPVVNFPLGFSISMVTTLSEMNIFVDLFDKAHSGADDEPYGKLPKEYGESLLDFFTAPPTDRSVIHYLGYFNGIPVGYATLIYSGRFAGIYNVGTIPEYRKRGVGTTLTLNAVTDALRNGAEIVYLVTEQGSYNEKLYSKMGFNARLHAKLHVLNK